MCDITIGLDFGNHSSFPCFIDQLDRDTKTGGEVHRLLPPTENYGIPTVYFYSKRRGVLCGYDAISSRATPVQNRLRYLKHKLGENVVLDGKTVSVDETVTELIQYCVRIANAQLLENFRETTNRISLAYPAGYTAEQREKLVALAQKATLADGTKVKVCGTIAEPAAAALNYLAMHGKTNKETTALVYDLGGDTFSASLVALYPRGRRNAVGKPYYYDIVCHCGLKDVGGKAFDEAMAELLCGKIEEALEGESLTERESELLRNTVAESAKIELSSMDTVDPEIIHVDEVVDVEVTREEFEEKTKPLLRKTIRLMKDILKDHPENKPEYIVLTGGSSEMPMVEKELEKYLKEYGDRIVKHFPSTAVAAGAARFGTDESAPITVGENAAKRSDAVSGNDRTEKQKERFEDASAVKKSFSQEELQSFCDLGEKYQYGKGVRTDYAKAAEYYRKAADQGHTQAQYNLGYCYECGKGVTKDLSEAARWYRKAAEQGHISAQCNLGYAYSHGQGVTQDYALAVKWYRKAAEQGNGQAQHNLGYCYDQGKGVAKDYVQAAKWFRKAAEQGRAKSQYSLALCYEYGDGVTVSEAEAIRWHKMAAKQDYRESKKQIRRLRAKGRIFPTFSLIALLLLLFACNGGALWQKLWSITPLGLGEATGIPGFRYSMIVVTVLSVLLGLFGLLGVWAIHSDKDSLGYKLKKCVLFLFLGIWYAGYGFSHLLVKITWGYYVFALLIAVAISVGFGFLLVFLLAALDYAIYDMPGTDKLFAERCARIDVRFITSMVIFHAGFCGFFALKNGMGVEDTLVNKLTFGALLVGGGLFSFFYAIKRIVAACGKYVDRDDKKCKRRSEIGIFILTLVLTVIFFAAAYGWKAFEGNATLEILTAPCVFTLPFVLVFRLIAIVALNKKIKNWY